MGEAVAHGAKRPHAREALFDALSLLPMEGEKNFEDMGEAAVYRAKSAYQRGQYHASCKLVDPLTGLCGSVVYLIIYLMLDIMALEIILLVLTDDSI